MSDLISRAEAIKAVEQEYKIDRGYMADDYTYGFNQAIQYVSDIILHDLPSAEAVPKDECERCFDKFANKITDLEEEKWIPCSERLPSESGTYLVTTAKGAVWADHFYANSVDDRHWSYRTRRVPIAWMPMPKPYKGGDTE